MYCGASLNGNDLRRPMPLSCSQTIWVALFIPGFRGPRVGFDRRRSARLIASLLSISMNACLAWERLSRDLRKTSPSRQSDEARAWAAASSSEHGEAGSLVDFPKTICSGLKPFFRIQASCLESTVSILDRTRLHRQWPFGCLSG